MSATVKWIDFRLRKKVRTTHIKFIARADAISDVAICIITYSKQFNRRFAILAFFDHLLALDTTQCPNRLGNEIHLIIESSFRVANKPINLDYVCNSAFTEQKSTRCFSFGPNFALIWPSFGPYLNIFSLKRSL